MQQVQVPLDRRGRPYTAMMLPELRLGLSPPNKGHTYPAQTYTDDEVRRLLGFYDGQRQRKRPAVIRAGVRNTALIEVMWRCGTRAAETVDLELEDLDMRARTLLVRHGKGDKRRLLGFPTETHAALEAWLAVRAELDVDDEQRRLFVSVLPHWYGQELRTVAVRTMLKRLAARTGVRKRVHPHGFRHTFAVNLLRRGVNVKIIQAALGHNDLETTSRYVDHVSNEEVLAVMRGRPQLRLIDGGATAAAAGTEGYRDLMDVFARAGRDELRALGDLFHRLAAEAA